jgi:G patch domain-containing protein 1
MPAKSIFDYMSAKSKERLAQVIPADRKPALAADLGEDPVEEAAPMAEGVVVPPLSPRTASAALKGFIPFGDDLAKQERYTSYLRSQTHDTKEPNPKLFPTGQLDHVNKELSDFAKSAQMFRPLSFAMANRFTSSKLSTQDMVQPKPGLHVPDPNKINEWKDKTKIEEEIKEVLTPREEAARAGLYGKMTRITSDWVPHALLCKRFGVANPWPDGPPGSKPAEGDAESASPAAQTGRALGTKPLLTGPGQDVAWQNNFVHQVQGPTAEKEEETLAPGEVPKERQPRSIVEVGLAEDANQGRDTLTYKKPEMNIFKAIFASDDEDDDENDEDESEDRQVAATSITPAIMMNTTSSTVATPPLTALPSANIPIASDIARPVFSSSVSRAAARNEIDSKKASSKKDKKRDRVKAKTMLSFDVGDDDEQDPASTGGESRDRKRRRKDEKRDIRPIKQQEVPATDVANDDDDWIEAPVVTGRM